MRKIVAFTGAGISKASGIPTFQDMEGIREKLSIAYFTTNPGGFYQALLEMQSTIENALPNPAHLSIAEYGIPVVTMNIDGLHRKAGSKHVVEVHGNLETVLCTHCGAAFDFSCIKQSLYCTECSSLLRPNVVLYGERIPKYYEAIDVIGSADELIVVGTSFYTSTSSDLVGRAARMGIKITTINSDAENEVSRYLKKLLGRAAEHTK